MTKSQKFYRDTLVIGIILIIIAAIIFSNFIPKLFSALSPMVFAFMLFYLSRPLVKFFHKKLHLTISVLITFLIWLVLFLGVFAAIIPAIYQSIVAIIDLLYSTTPDEFLDAVNTVPLISQYFDTTSLTTFFQTVYDLIDQYLSYIVNYATSLITSITNLFGKIVLSFMGVLMAFYLLRDSVDSAMGNVSLFIKSIMPEKASKFVLKVARLTDESIRKFLVGKLFTSAILGIVIFLLALLVNLLSPLSIPYLPLLALLMGIGNLIPYVGSILTAIPCLLLCLLTGAPEAGGFLIILLFVQAIDNMIITPKILGDSIGLQPFWIIVGITVVGGLTGSVIGMILSVPFVAVIVALAEERMATYLKEKQKEFEEKEQEELANSIIKNTDNDSDLA